MKITVRYLERTCLEEQAYVKLLRKYKKLKKNLLVVFDKRIKDFGQYTYDSDKKLHIIRISPKKNKKDTKYDDEAFKYQLISTTLHEIKHAQQKEQLRC